MVSFDGHGWFDLHEPRLGPPEGYDTHWSRLIDAGLAGLVWLFGLFTGPAMAERLMRVVWPMLWLVPTMAGVTAIAWRVAGREAAPIALVLTAVGLPAFAHFAPGRIDHHNVQIALAVLLVAAVAWSDRERFAAAAAGLLTGAAMAIGFEGLPYIVLAGVALALRFIFTPDGDRALARYGIWAAGSVAAAFLISVGPAHWGRTACDAIAINSAAGLILVTLGLAVTGRLLGTASWPARAAGIAAAGAVAAAAFVAVEPRCLAGPFAMMDPTVRALWFNNVSEMQSLWAVALEIAAGRCGDRRLPGRRPPRARSDRPPPGDAARLRLSRRRCGARDRYRGHVLHGPRFQLRDLARDPRGRGRRGAACSRRCGRGRSRRGPSSPCSSRRR